MSDYLKPTLYNGRGLENQLKNICYNAHDLCCGCPNPTSHLRHLFGVQCLSTETSTKENSENSTNKENPEEGFDAGDLEALFATDEDDRG